MSVIFFHEFRCPHCRTAFAFKPFGVRGNLGPPIFVCGECRKPFSSGRREWQDLSIWNRICYAIASAGRTLFSAFIGLMAFATASGQKAPGIIGAVGASIGGILAMTVQIWRVAASRKRTEGQIRAVRLRLFSVHADAGVFLIVCISVAAVLVYAVRVAGVQFD